MSALGREAPGNLREILLANAGLDLLYLLAGALLFLRGRTASHRSFGLAILAQGGSSWPLTWGTPWAWPRKAPGSSRRGFAKSSYPGQKFYKEIPRTLPLGRRKDEKVDRSFFGVGGGRLGPGPRGPGAGGAPFP
ncbi:DUF6992 family protein [Thermus amyloliquefaciens]|uniref:DUF6992 family protein n=1 Tax=Thermus amyloliquefaciens TaxID=1449080 RepID=UPI003CCBD58D